MDTIENRLQSVKARQNEAQRRQATVEAKLEQVDTQRKQLLAALKEQGFETPDEARQHVEELKQKTEAILTQIEEKVSGL